MPETTVPVPTMCWNVRSLHAELLTKWS